MNKLLMADFYRLCRSRVFWILMAVVAGASLWCIQSAAGSWEATRDSGICHTLDDYLFTLAPYGGVVFAVFISLFLGTEYSDGTLRNKLCVGHLRLHVYLSGYAVCLSAALALDACWLLCGIPGFFTIGPLEMGLSGFLTYLAVIVCFTAALTAIFTLVNLLCTNKALSLTLCLAIWIVMILLASGANDRLNEPEMNGGMAYIDGAFVLLDETPNPLYVAGAARLALECLQDLLPTGPAILMTDAHITHPVREILLGAALTALLLAAGIRAFRAKDIK